MQISSIMVIDDSEADQFYVKTILNNKYPNANVVQAYDGQEALDLLEKNDVKYDIIFLDINMPRMTGHEFLEKYGNVVNDPTDVIIMLTSSSQKEDKEKALSYSYVKKYWNKPITLDSIDDVIFGSQEE